MAMSSGKRKRRFRAVSEEAAALIDDCRRFFEREHEQGQRISLTRPVERTAAAFNIGERTVRRIRTKLENGEPFDEDTRDMVVPEYFVPVIRQTITQMYADKNHVTLTTLLAELQAERVTRSSGWKWSRATLHRFLTTKMSFSYGQRPSYYQQLKENASVAAQRTKYIREIKAARAAGRPIVYQDETWANKNMTPIKEWVDECGSGGLKVPSGRGERSIICHIGGSAGFVDGAKLIFRGAKSLKDADYHTEMNASVFLDWMERRVLPAMPANAVIVIDRASYHRTLTPDSQPVRSTWKKAALIEWLVTRNIVAEGMSTADDYNKMTRPEIYKICRENAPTPVYQVCELAKRFGCDALFLPVGHPELNPIELVWARLKVYIAQRNVNFSLNDVERLAHSFIDTFTATDWEKYVNHCIKVEDNYIAAADHIELGDEIEWDLEVEP